MNQLFSKNRFSIVFSFILIYCLLGLALRTILFLLSFNAIDLSLFNILKIVGLGFVFDFGTAIFFILFYALYLFFFPKKYVGSMVDKSLTYFILFFIFIITIFSFLAEFPFWDEFSTRFNFIAVDYLIYTFEVIENINQSYPLPLLILVILGLTALFFFYFFKTKKFKDVFISQISFKKRLFYVAPLLVISLIYIQFITNKQAETSKNLYVNELSKNGVYSFFAAFRSNELDFMTFYPTLPNEKAFAITKKEILQTNQKYTNTNLESLERKVTNDSIESHPNVILICIESFSAEFMSSFGNKENLTPFLDGISKESIFLRIYTPQEHELFAAWKH